MKEIFESFYDLIMNTIDNLGIYGPLFGSVLIIIESILPMLPLFVFITINYLAFGHFLGFIISWTCTILGCLLSYFLVKKYFSNFVLRKAKDKELLNKFVGYFKDVSLPKITVIMSIPFTPAFLMNIAAGLVKMPFKKFLLSLLISKLFLVYFWGEVGTGLIESFKNPSSLITVVLMVVIAYLFSLLVKKIFKIE